MRNNRRSHEAKQYIIELPTFHADQVRVFNLGARFTAVRAGRRWGKTAYATTVSSDKVLRGDLVGYFAPEYKFIAEPFTAIRDQLAPIIANSSQTAGIIKTINGGQIDFWTMDNELCGRGRRYHLIVIDEAAFAKERTGIDLWRKNIRPTLVDYRGSALVLSNTNGISEENLLWALCNIPEYGFVEYHAPSHANPYLPRDELALIEKNTHPLVYAQEYLAEFVDFSGVAFFSLDAMLNEHHQPLDWPMHYDAVYAVIDTATKTGTDNDGTAVVYFALSRSKKPALVVLDWDIAQIEGSLLEHWLPSVFMRLDELALTCETLLPPMGVWIEDASSGAILLQQAARRNLPARAIESRLTMMGKDERAISVSGYVYNHQVKLARAAYEKTKLYKGATRNHFLSQVTGFRIGDKDHAKRADDIIDCYCYGIAIGLGDSSGF